MVDSAENKGKISVNDICAEQLFTKGTPKLPSIMTFNISAAHEKLLHLRMSLSTPGVDMFVCFELFAWFWVIKTQQVSRFLLLLTD